MLATIACTGVAPAQKRGAAAPGSDVPEAARSRTNPISSTPEVMEQALDLYQKNCFPCHGSSGRGDGPATQFVKTRPADLTNREEQDRLTDGEIFWRVSEGKDPMPPFKKKLSEEERWKLVLHVRSLRAR